VTLSLYNNAVKKEQHMKVCEQCKHRKQCADLPGICLRLPGILAASVAAMVVFFIATSSL
jgi:hypothetical protein